MAHRDLPFPCLVVRHRGARRMTLRVSAAGVRLTVPARSRAADIDRFLRASEGWVREQRARLDDPAPALAPGDRIAHPDGDLVLDVRRGARRASARRAGDRLVVSLPPEGDLDAVVERWYRREAASVLSRRADIVADRLGVTVAGVSIRDPRGRWGSCSSAGRLSFSWRLLLAPEPVMDYVVAHEVCHLVEPNHSACYWALVARTFPGHEGARAWLRDNGARLHAGPARRTVHEDVSPA